MLADQGVVGRRKRRRRLRDERAGIDLANIWDGRSRRFLHCVRVALAQSEGDFTPAKIAQVDIFG